MALHSSAIRTFTYEITKYFA